MKTNQIFMKKLVLMFTLGLLLACSSSTLNEDGSEKGVSNETSKKIKEAQDENVELEAIDGELDSIINSLK
jgi:uncharacterized protein YcfL